MSELIAYLNMLRETEEMKLSHITAEHKGFVRAILEVKGFLYRQEHNEKKET